jgi:indole-3-glycerol phosphate synthase
MDKLAEIMARKRRDVEPLIRPIPDREWERLRAMRRIYEPFGQVLARPDRLSVIAEVKRRSPSAGAIADGMDAVEQARTYFNAEADALSVLTDEPYFGGKLQDLWDIVEFFEIHQRKTPCLRKDFMVHPVQVAEAAEAGAAAILIIVRALEDDEIRALDEAAQRVGLDALYEVHTEAELERALTFDPSIVGVNNRDLTRFVTDLGISEALLPQIPDDVVAVSESGIFEPEDAARVRSAGADAILVGEALMKAEDPEALVAAFHDVDDA